MSRISEWSRGKQNALLVTVVLACTIGLGVVAEVAVRIRAYVKYGTSAGIEQTYQFDAGLGLRVPVPGARFGSVRISEQGFRGPAVALPKGRDTLRIAFLGGSTTFCAEVSDETAAWPHLVTEAIRARYSDVTVDYVNAGVPGFGVEHARQYLEKRVAEFAPDVIVIYEATNDLSGNSYVVAASRGLASGRTEQNMSWLAQYSTLWYLVEKNLEIMSQQAGAANATGKLALTADTLDAIVDPFRRDFARLVGSSRAVAPLVVVATFAPRIRREQSPEQQREAAVTSLYYMPYMTTQGLVDAFAAYNDAIVESVAGTDALLIPAAEAIPGDGDHYVDSVHFSDAGSRAMARVVGDGLLASGRLEALVAAKRSR